MAYGGIKALVAAIPQNTIPDEAVIGLNVPALLFSLSVAVFTALLFGLAPALHLAKPDIVEPLKDSGKGVSGGFRHGNLRNILVVFEVTLSLVLLVGAGLLMRSFVALQQVELGLNPDNILVARLPLPANNTRRLRPSSTSFANYCSDCTRCPEWLQPPKPARCRPTAAFLARSTFPARRIRINGMRYSSYAAKATFRQWGYGCFAAVPYRKRR